MLRIEVAGGIASGKTTLARILTSRSVAVLYENFLKNPFWRDFYRSPLAYAFETEVTFLLQHYSQVKTAELTQSHVVLDTSFLVDLGYADINLSGAEYDAFSSVYAVVQSNLSTLDHLIWLRCGEAAQLARIRSRGREEEAAITKDYLRSLNTAIHRRVNELRASVNVIEVDSEGLDFAHSTDVQRELMKEIYLKIGFEAIG